MRKASTLIPFLVPASKRTISVLGLVAEFVDEFKFLTNWETFEHDGWTLPAIKEKYDWCGLWQTFGCLNHKAHEMLGKGTRIYLKQYQRSCYRALCKECFVKWIARQANKSTRRIEKYSNDSGKKPIHLMLMVPQSQHDLPLKLLKNRLKDILETAQWEGGAVIFHPFRFDQKTRRWYYWPHFHLVGFGNERQIAQAYGKYGWYLKIAEERESIFQTFCYLLSHCGIKKGTHTVVWIGSLSYSKLKIEKEPKVTCCPICGGDFEEIYYEELYHPVVPPDKPYEGLVDADGWYPVKTMNVESLESFHYSPINEVNEILKGITETS